MRTRAVKVPQRLVFEEDTKDYILLENGKKLYFKNNPKDNAKDYNRDKSFYIGRVENEETGKEEFVKFVNLEDCEESKNKWRIENLKREGAFQFHYPFIVQVYGNFEGIAVGHLANEKIEMQIFGVRMEYVTGMNVACYWKKMDEDIKNNICTWEEIEKQTFKHMRQLLYGMRYYTEYTDPSYLTRDLKPLNVMIDGFGNVKIIDFDYAHISGSDATKRGEAHHYLGVSDGFTDPRTATEREFDIKSEIYEAGKTLFFWINGKRYFAPSEETMYYNDNTLAYGNDIGRYAERYQEDCFEELRNILGKMYAPLEQRYENISQIIEDFEAFLEKYYGGKEELEAVQLWNQMSLLQTRGTGRAEKSVGSKICKMGAPVERKPLKEYAMRPIFVETKKHDEKKVMTVYMLHDRIYYIPAMGVKVERVGVRDDYEILDGDEFIAEDIKFKFLL